MGPVGQVQRDGLCGADHATSQNLGAGAGPATRFERVDMKLRTIVILAAIGFAAGWYGVLVLAERFAL